MPFPACTSLSLAPVLHSRLSGGRGARRESVVVPKATELPGLSQAYRYSHVNESRALPRRGCVAPLMAGVVHIDCSALKLVVPVLAETGLLSEYTVQHSPASELC